MTENTIISARLCGGVGNQMFQIATAYATAKKFNCSFQILKNHFGGALSGSHPSKYYDTLYKKIELMTEVKDYSVIREKEFTFSSILDDVSKFISSNTITKPIFLSGYFQSELYFNDYSKEVKELFTPEKGIVDFLDTNTPIFEQFPELKLSHDYAVICIRRGDYLKHANMHNPCGMDYFTKAMNVLKKERYYIITDDFEWAKTKFVGEPFRFIDAITDDLHHLFIIALFKNYIISNSSFHWWGSFLSIYENPTIIAPDKWLFGKDAKKEQYWSIYRDSMTVLERTVETN